MRNEACDTIRRKIHFCIYLFCVISAAWHTHPHMWLHCIYTRELALTIVNKEEGLEAGGVAKLCYCSMSRDNTSALESCLVIQAVQGERLCLAKKLVFLARSRKCRELIVQFTVAEPEEAQEYRYL